jgi:hypothetical protein
MSKYILESYKEFRDQYLKIQGEINVLRDQISGIKGEIYKKGEDQSVPLTKSRWEFLNMFKPLKSRMESDYHLEIDQIDPFFYRMYFNKVDKREDILELLEKIILVFEDISASNNDLKLEMTFSIGKGGYDQLLILKSYDGLIRYKKSGENVKDKEAQLQVELVEYGLMEFDEGDWDPISPFEIVSLLNKLEDIVEKGEDFELDRHFFE